MQGSCTTGFQIHVTLNPLKDVGSQIERRKLVTRLTPDQGSTSALKSIIDKNSSLRISFGWSFESTDVMKKMMDECLLPLEESYGHLCSNLVTDLRGDWFAFMPYNTFEKSIYENLDSHGLITFNNRLCDFQLDVIESIRDHRIYRQHLILKDTNYRYDIFRNVRKNPTGLVELFHNVIESLEGTLGITKYPRQIIEEMVGCHFLYYPDIFFELLEFYMLKGMIYE